MIVPLNVLHQVKLQMIAVVQFKMKNKNQLKTQEYCTISIRCQYGKLIDLKKCSQSPFKRIFERIGLKIKKQILNGWIQFRFNMQSILIINDITPQIIAMGYPADNFESLYRNSLDEVQRFLNTRHPEKYKVINLCSERQYRHDLFYKVVEFPFEDHQPPPFQIILPFCLTVSKWLKKQDRVVAVHCKAGKGRTGTMISCYLLFSKQYDSSKDALKYYAMIRTQNQEGVTIPSQARYVEYFNIALKMNLLYVPARTVELIEVRLVGLPNFGIFGGCKPFIRIQNENKQLIQQPTILTNQDQQKQYSAIFKFQGVYLNGDVVVQFFHKSIVLEEKMFQAWFHTSFIMMNPQLQIFNRDELDGVSKDKQFKKFPMNFSLEILFDKVVAIRRRSDCIK
ncbi:unnamed protein product [Paramecium pentaurelia]|uniref:Phosphatidylinositol-3,4,5-trisphosphate 3-phosphatase n=1 Tax=Paramecium pentaurelia TaxID=43138 RepID=A0A8S1SH62_9CILI|nr:unnamed protein product [Paramecium pentaurelia]